MSTAEEMEAGRKALARQQGRGVTDPGTEGANERHVQVNPTDTASKMPHPADPVAAAPAAASPTGEANASQGAPAAPRTAHTVAPGTSQAEQTGTSPALDFLDDFYGPDKRHLVAIKKQVEGMAPTIKARHFDAVDRAGQEKFITDQNCAGFDIYFGPNPVKATLHKKATKNDVVEARYLWIDLDPRKNEPLGPERAAMLALLTTNLSEGLPRPNRVIDSGRGYWGFWKLATPHPVDGARYEDGHIICNNPQTDVVESYGRGIEQVFGGRFADGCRNIDRIARLPGTINCKTGELARVLHEYSHDEPHVIEEFPSSVTKSGNQPVPSKEFKGEYEPVMRDAPELATLEPVWVTRIFDGDLDGKYQNDRSRMAFAVACELVRVEIDDNFIARVLMTTRCGVHVQERAAYRLPRTLRRAHEFAIDPDLEQMNSKHAVLPLGDKTRVATWGDDDDFPGRKVIVRAQSLADFAGLHNNKRKTIMIPEVDEHGKETGQFKPKRVRLGSWWISHTGRRQYDGGRKFMPRHDADVIGNVLNMFEGFPIQARKPEGCSGASGCQLFLDHGFKIMCSSNEEHWDYLLKREAWIAQRRRRSEVAAAYRTEEEGSGKGFWCNHLGRLYGAYFMQVNNPEHVIGKHNPHLETLLKLCADEALFVGDPRHRNALFGLITEPTLTIEPKNINAYKAANHLNVDITTNTKHFAPASRTARRFFIPTVSEARVGDLEYFQKIEDQLKNGGYEALLYHLLCEVDLRDFDVRRVPKTAGLVEQIEYSRKGLDGLIEKICSEGRVPCAHHQWPGFSVSNGSEMRQGFDYFIDNHPDRELRSLGALKIKRDLRKHWQCRSGDDAKRRDGGGMTYGVKWPSLQELRELFERRHGRQEWLHPEVTEWPVSSSATFDEVRALNDQDVGEEAIQHAMAQADLDLVRRPRLVAAQALDDPRRA